MTQPEEAVGSESTVDVEAEAIAAFEAEAATAFEDEPEEEESDSDDDIELEAEEEEHPPIEAPVSWDAEAKEIFASLPREAQEIVQKREADRERFVQAKSQEAARAMQGAEQAAFAQLAQIEQGYAQTLQQLAEQVTPQRPNPALLQHDPQAFYAMQAEYEASTAQQQELQQRAQQFAMQAQQREVFAEQQAMAEQYQILTEHFPEYTDPTTGPKVQAELSAVARDLGFPPELIAQARAVDILAMKQAASWKAKADRYDALQSGKMAKVRAAKGLPKVAKPGAAVSADQSRAARQDAAWARAKSGRTTHEKAEGFADWAEGAGIL